MEVRALAADGVVFLDGEVVLLERNHPPHEGEWVLPGGMVERSERAAAACVRELREEIGIEVRTVDFLGLYDAPDRDPRGNVSAAYLCRPESEDPSPRPREEARRVERFPIEDPPEMGFDHRAILVDAHAAVSSE